MRAIWTTECSGVLDAVSTSVGFAGIVIVAVSLHVSERRMLEIEAGACSQVDLRLAFIAAGAEAGEG